MDGGAEFQGACEQQCRQREIKPFVLPPRSPDLGPYRFRLPAKVHSSHYIADRTIEMLDLAGVPEPERVQGISFADALRDAGAYTRSAALTENDDDRMPVRMRTLTTADWRLTAYADGADGEMYDRAADPEETHNRYDDPAFAPIRRELEAMLFEEVLCACDHMNGSRQHPATAVTRWVPRHNRAP